MQSSKHCTGAHVEPRRAKKPNENTVKDRTNMAQIFAVSICEEESCVRVLSRKASISERAVVVSECVQDMRIRFL